MRKTLLKTLAHSIFLWVFTSSIILPSQAINADEYYGSQKQIDYQVYGSFAEFIATWENSVIDAVQKIHPQVKNIDDVRILEFYKKVYNLLSSEAEKAWKKENDPILRPAEEVAFLYKNWMTFIDQYNKLQINMLLKDDVSEKTAKKDMLFSIVNQALWDLIKEKTVKLESIIEANRRYVQINPYYKDFKYQKVDTTKLERYSDTWMYKLNDKFKKALIQDYYNFVYSWKISRSESSLYTEVVDRVGLSSTAKIDPDEPFTNLLNKQMAPIEQFVKTIPQYYSWFIPTVYMWDRLVNKVWIIEDFKKVQKAKLIDYDNNNILNEKAKLWYENLTKEETEERKRLHWNLKYAGTAIMEWLWIKWWMWDWKTSIIPTFNSNNTFQLTMYHKTSGFWIWQAWLRALDSVSSLERKYSMIISQFNDKENAIQLMAYYDNKAWMKQIFWRTNTNIYSSPSRLTVWSVEWLGQKWDMLNTYLYWSHDELAVSNISNQALEWTSRTIDLSSYFDKILMSK